MNVLIIEDELPTQRMMTELITSLRPDWQILACLDSVRDSVAWLKNIPIPISFSPTFNSPTASVSRYLMPFNRNRSSFLLPRTTNMPFRRSGSTA